MRSFDHDWIDSAEVNLERVKETCSNILCRRYVGGDNRAAWLLRAVSSLDLTSLNADDTPSSIFRLCSKAVNPLASEICSALDLSPAAAAVCVYPSRVQDCVKAFSGIGYKLPIAAVAGGFPSGQYSLISRREEINYAIQEGANEIDVVIDRALVHKNDWEGIFQQLCEMKAVCRKALFKVIISAGELGTLKNVRNASLVAMMAGADFIKTSTGKESVNATYPVTLTMLRAISDYYSETRHKVGFKPAGGIRTSEEALNYQILVNDVLGSEWLCNDRFRIGASGLLSDLEQQLLFYATKRSWDIADLYPC